MKVLSFQDVALGEGRVRAFTVIEIKRLFSVIIYKWETVDQVRFHTHAFPAVGFLLAGSYLEQRIVDGRVEDNLVSRRFFPRWLPRNYCHAIKRSFGLTLSVVITGRWRRTWWEYFPATVDLPGHWQEYTWGRKKLRRVVGDVSLYPEIEKAF